MAMPRRAPIHTTLTRMTRIPRAGGVTALTRLAGLTSLARVISMVRLTGKSRPEGL